MVYPSKKDTWLVLLVTIPGLALSVSAIYQLVVRGSGDAVALPLLAAALLYWAVIVLLAYPVYYEITSSKLVIRSGWLLKYEIVLTSIDSVRPTRNPLSAPAWSLDRLSIDYKKNARQRFALISPQDKMQFLRELAERTSNLTLRGDALVRTS
ncbi:MAG: PH domain-containing protein [Acidiferrobacterales bacterium]